ncbi:MAG: hypothetical protein R3F47_11720 [Gammaproteobacteria bacterium]
MKPKIVKKCLKIINMQAYLWLRWDQSKQERIPLAREFPGASLSFTIIDPDPLKVFLMQ